MNLPTNFRSRRHVVAGVGTLFNTPPLSSALPASELAHVWQEVASEEASVPIQVLAPYAATDDDARSPDQLAAAAAAQVVRQLKNDRKVTNWADVLVLTRSRTEVTLYEQAFRDAGIPFVPAGRGMLGASREVQDILSLLRWLLWPDDDAALATVLRSPLFRLDEATFQQLLGRRALLVPGAKEGTFRTPHTIWRTLRNASGEPIFAPIVELLTGWRKHLGFETVHDLLRRIFREGDVIARYRLARGDQAEYNLLRLYDLALSGEVSGTPTVRRLVDFLTRAAARGGQAEGAVPQGGSAGRVRLMTIHGAKGLEAEVVVMIDANRAVGRESACVKLQPESPVTPLMFKVVQAHRRGYGLPDGVHWPQDPLQRVCAAARDVDCTENANLLYVAMTRAKDRLVVVGADRERGKPDDSPLRQILTGVAACSEPEHFQMDDPAGMTRPPVAVSLPKSGAASLDTVRVWTPPIPRETMRVVTPSAVHDTDGPLTVPGRTEYSDEDPTRRGEQVHLLLQLAADSGRLPVGTSAHHAEAAGVFEVPQLDWVFRPETVGGRGLSEVPVMHRRREPAADGVEERLTGVIDRLVLRPDRVDIVDYKTNRFGGDGTVRSNLVNHYRPQLAGYREAVASMYPGREIHTWLLFTEPGVPDADRLAEVVTT